MANMLNNIFKKKKPNIIMIMMDGVRHDTIDKVPFYNELKKESIFFPRLITYAPYTIASLHAIFSGMYGKQNGVNGYYKSYSFDKQNCFTLTQYLKKAGYYTEADFVKKDIAPNQGFDIIRDYDEFNEDLIRRHSEILTQIKSKKPFFLFMDYITVHTNLVKNVIKKYSDFDVEYFNNKNMNFKEYLTWVKDSGDYLKIILNRIKELGLWDTSMIIIFTDHGVSIGDKIGEKAYGVYLYEYTLRCFLYLIGKNLPKNVEARKPIRSIDILPTILDFLKLKEKTNYKKIQGKSFLPFINGRADDRIAYSETGGLGGPTPSPEIHNVQCVRTNKWKLIYNKTNKKKELYNLEEDKEEKNNLAGKRLKIEEELWKELQRINEEHKRINDQFK